MLEVGHVGLQFLRRPKPPSVRITEATKDFGAYAMFDADAFEVEAAVALRGDGTGARLGWTQLQTLDVDRALYRGLTPDAGRVQVWRERSKAATAPLCRDVSSASDVFTAPAGAKTALGYTPRHPFNVALTPVHLPATVPVSHGDKPGGWYAALQDNDRTRKPNYLSWALIEMRFCVVLLLQHKNGRVEQLKHFYWSLKWEDRFEPVKGGGEITTVRRISGDDGHKMAFKQFVDGPVTDGRLAALIAAKTTQTCNKRAELRYNNPEVHHYARW